MINLENRFKNVPELLGVREDKSHLCDFRIGDTIQVHIKLTEGKKERIQILNGFVLKTSGYGMSKTFTIREIFASIGIEITFFLYSPKIDKIKFIRKGRVRRAKLYYLRDRIGKSAQVKSQR